MFRIHVEEYIQATIGQVFEALSDHARYDRFPGIRRARLIQPGTEEPNGTGAIREIHAGPIVFRERITAFEAPTHLAYRIMETRPVSTDHQLGEIWLYDEGEQTRVIWRSEGHIQVPLLGRALDAMADRQAAATFRGILRAIPHLREP